MVFILDSFLGLQKGSNIEPQARPDVAEDLLAFPIHLALFRQTSTRVDTPGSIVTFHALIL
jgi:hypothetical protein